MTDQPGQPGQISSLRDMFAALETAAERTPASLAFISPWGQSNYARFWSNISSAASAALKNGIKPGQLIVVAVRNSDTALILALALMRIGCRVGYAANLPLYDAAAVPVDAVIAEKNIETRGRHLITIDAAWFNRDAAQRTELPNGADACSLISSSSGSTGIPKLIEVPARAIVRSVNTSVAADSLRLMNLMGDRVKGSLCEAIAVFLNGGVAIRLRDRRPETILDAIQLYRPDLITIAPFNIVEILKKLEQRPIQLDKVKTLRSTGAFFADELRDAVLEKIADDAVSVYSSTESGRIASGSAAELKNVPSSVGRIYDDVEIAAFDDQGRMLPPGQPGEIRVRVPEDECGHYLGRDLDRQTAFKDGWFSTGDRGTIDENRNLLITGRINYVINAGGDKISPEEIERHLLSYPTIRDVGVTGVAVRERFDRVCALVASDREPTVAELNAFLRKRGSWPIEFLRIVKAIPRTEAGKIDRAGLKRLALQNNDGR